MFRWKGFGTQARHGLRVVVGMAGATALLAGLVAGPIGATGGGGSGGDHGGQQRSLQHVGSFFVDDNLRADEPLATPTSAEIVDITRDGETLVYTDAFTERLGFVDISDPKAPAALGGLDLPGGPTSVAIHRRWALVAIVTSQDPDGAGPLNEFDAPAGQLLVIDLATRATVRTIRLAGQPDWWPSRLTANTRPSSSRTSAMRTRTTASSRSCRPAHSRSSS